MYFLKDFTEDRDHRYLSEIFFDIFRGVNLGNRADKRVLIECWVLLLGNAGCYDVMNNRC